MGRKVLASIACITVVLSVAYTFSDKLKANEQTGLPSGYAVPDHAPTPPGVIVDYSSGRVPTQAEIQQNLAAIQQGLASPGWVPGITGTFSLVSDGKRSIKINTQTGESWLLLATDKGSSWERIKADNAVPATGAVSSR